MKTPQFPDKLHRPQETRLAWTPKATATRKPGGCTDSPLRASGKALSNDQLAQEGMDMKSKKSARKHKLDVLTTTTGTSLPAVQKSARSEEISEAAKQAFANWMKEVSGTEDAELQGRLLDQAVGAVPDFVGQELKSFDCVVAALHGIGPKDALEGMLAVQLVAVHMIAMECLKRAALPNQIDLGVEVNVNRGTKLMRTFASLTEALSRYRGKGEQKMIVEHVHVHKGGQAIVGPVSQNNSGNRGGGDEKG